jgi:hypothetical protein
LVPPILRIGQSTGLVDLQAVSGTPVSDAAAVPADPQGVSGEQEKEAKQGVPDEALLCLLRGAWAML